MNRKIEGKEGHYLWGSMSSNDIQENCIEFENVCSSIGIKRVFQKNSIITNIGEKVSGVYFLYKGISISQIVGENGLEKVVFFNRAPCFFNEGPFIGNLYTEMEIRALTDCSISVISFNELDKLISSNKLYNYLFMRFLARKAYALLSQMNDVLTLTPAKRILKVITYLAQENSLTNLNTKDKETIVHFSQEELARICGVHRVTVARAFRKFKDMGIITKISKSKIFLAADFESILLDELEGI